MRFVIDASLAIKWLIGDERSAVADHLLESVSSSGASVPPIFPAEVENVLLVAERRQRIATVDVEAGIAILKELDITVASLGGIREIGSALAIARTTGLTAYDASYLLLARDLGSTLLTADARLHAAAALSNVTSVFAN